MYSNFHSGFGDYTFNSNFRAKRKNDFSDYKQSCLNIDSDYESENSLKNIFQKNNRQYKKGFNNSRYSINEGTAFKRKNRKKAA